MCDSLGFYSIGNNFIAHNHLGSDGKHLTYNGADVLCENIAFSLFFEQFCTN